MKDKKCATYFILQLQPASLFCIQVVVFTMGLLAHPVYTQLHILLL